MKKLLSRTTLNGVASFVMFSVGFIIIKFCVFFVGLSGLVVCCVVLVNVMFMVVVSMKWLLSMFKRNGTFVVVARAGE